MLGEALNKQNQMKGLKQLRIVELEVFELINRTDVEKLGDTEYYHYVGNFCRKIVFSGEFNGKLSAEQLEDAEFLMRNGIGRVKKGSGSYFFVQGAISKLQLLIVFGYDQIVNVPNWVYGWKEEWR